MTDPQSDARDVARDLGVYGISVAARLVGTGVQNLRAYEAKGLLAPDRTAGGTRLYSQEDIVRLCRITALLDGGLNLAGVAMVLSLEDANAALHQQNSTLLRERRRSGPSKGPGVDSDP